MDKETEILLSKLLEKNSPKFSWTSVIQTIVIAIIIGIPTVILTSARTANNVENAMIRHENTLSKIKKRADFNYKIIKDELEELNDHKINFIELDDE